MYSTSDPGGGLHLLGRDPLQDDPLRVPCRRPTEAEKERLPHMSLRLKSAQDQQQEDGVPAGETGSLGGEMGYLSEEMGSPGQEDRVPGWGDGVPGVGRWGT